MLDVLRSRCVRGVISPLSVSPTVSLQLTDSSGDTALLHACRRGSFFAARALLAAGARADATNAAGASPLTAALDGGHARLAALLTRGGGGSPAGTDGGDAPSPRVFRAGVHDGPPPPERERGGGGGGGGGGESEPRASPDAESQADMLRTALRQRSAGSLSPADVRLFARFEEEAARRAALWAARLHPHPHIAPFPPPPPPAPQPPQPRVSAPAAAAPHTAGSGAAAAHANDAFPAPHQRHSTSSAANGGELHIRSVRPGAGGGGGGGGHAAIGIRLSGGGGGGGGAAGAQQNAGHSSPLFAGSPLGAPPRVASHHPHPPPSSLLHSLQQHSLQQHSSLPSSLPHSLPHSPLPLRPSRRGSACSSGWGEGAAEERAEAAAAAEAAALSAARLRLAAAVASAEADFACAAAAAAAERSSSLGTHRGRLSEAQAVARVEHLEEELEKATMCAVCLSSPKTCILLPCRHQPTCAPCAELVMAKQPPRCPICRAGCTAYIEAFV